MGMKKFLCAIIGLLFAVPSFANCNLFDKAQTPYNSGVYISSATVGQTGFSTDVNTNYNVYRIKVQPNTTYTFGKIKASQPYWVVTDSSNKVLQTAQNNGGTEGVDITITTETSAKYLYLSVGVNSTYKCDDILQLEQGDTATAYTPYNPQCATCDGTVVNYTSATGTVTQNGTPTPTNPIYPTFYTQGDMVLRRVDDYADTYDATTGKITRRVGVKVLDGTENWSLYVNRFVANTIDETAKEAGKIISSHFESVSVVRLGSGNGKLEIFQTAVPDLSTIAQFKSWLVAQKAAGTPVTVYYQLATPVEEDWTETSYCFNPIKIASTKYTETVFNPLNTALANAVATVNTVVTQTIAQAASIATLQSGKQTRPADNAECPAYKQCLLVEDESGTPHWYEITDPFRDFVAPIIANNVAPASTTNQPGFTQLEWIQASGSAYIDTGIKPTSDYEHVVAKFSAEEAFSGYTWRIFGSQQGNCSLVPWPVYDNTNPLGYLAAGGSWYLPRTQNNTISTRLNTPYEMDVIADRGNISGTYCGETFSSTYSGQINQSLTITLFKNNGQAGDGSGGRIYYFKLWTAENVLAFDGIPAKRNSDNAIGMYDTVTKTFFANAGSGTFTAGPVVANTDVPANPTWTATWAANATTGVSAGTVTGEGLCNGVAGTESTAATSAQMSSANWSVDGANCWCRATSVDDGNESSNVNGVWVFYYARSSAADCALNCAYACAARVRDNASFRSAVFGM